MNINYSETIRFTNPNTISQKVINTLESWISWRGRFIEIIQKDNQFIKQTEQLSPPSFWTTTFKIVTFISLFFISIPLALGAKWVARHSYQIEEAPANTQSPTSPVTPQKSDEEAPEDSELPTSPVTPQKSDEEAQLRSPLTRSNTHKSLKIKLLKQGVENYLKILPEGKSNAHLENAKRNFNKLLSPNLQLSQENKIVSTNNNNIEIGDEFRNSELYMVLSNFKNKNQKTFNFELHQDGSINLVYLVQGTRKNISLFGSSK